MQRSAIAEGAAKLAEVTAGAGGAWARALQDVIDGAHTYTVTATDAGERLAAGLDDRARGRDGTADVAPSAPA